MDDQDLTGPSRVAWQLLGLLTLLVVLVVYGIAPMVVAHEAPASTGKVINWADLPEGTPCSCPVVKP